jgi:hypothetical protein
MAGDAPGASFVEPGEVVTCHDRLSGVRTDRLACNTAYPPRIGNYLSHAECVNAAVERDAIPRARYPDLVRLQERLRISYSAQIDNGKITPKTGEGNMAEADQLVANATIERDAGRSEVADNQVARLDTILRH